MAAWLASIVACVTFVFVEGAYVGCFVDSKDRLLLRESLYIDNQLTTNKCIQRCIQRGNTYAGTENKNECFCGDNIDFTKKTSDGLCSLPCGGNENERCGGSWALSVYTTASPTVADIQTTTDTETTDVLTTTGQITKLNVQTTYQISTADTNTIHLEMKTTTANSETKDIRATVQVTKPDIQAIAVTRETTADTKTTHLDDKTTAVINVEQTDLRIATVQSTKPATLATAVTQITVTDTKTARLDAETTTINDETTAVGKTTVQGTKPGNQSGNNIINCTCCNFHRNSSTELSWEQYQKILSQLQKLLTVPKTSTSNYKRKRISEYDSRPSSIAMGGVAIFVLSVIALIIVVPDIIRMALYIQKRRLIRN